MSASLYTGGKPSVMGQLMSSTFITQLAGATRLTVHGRGSCRRPCIQGESLDFDCVDRCLCLLESGHLLYHRRVRASVRGRRHAGQGPPTSYLVQYSSRVPSVMGQLMSSTFITQLAGATRLTVHGRGSCRRPCIQGESLDFDCVDRCLCLLESGHLPVSPPGTCFRPWSAPCRARAANFIPCPIQFPSAYLWGVLEPCATYVRGPATRHPACIIGDCVPAGTLVADPCQTRPNLLFLLVRCLNGFIQSGQPLRG